MAMDQNWFDDLLKERLYRDLMFRLGVWTMIAALTTYFASRNQSFSAVQNLKRTIETLGPVLNAVGVTAIVGALLALLLKDLEHVEPTTWGKDTILGRIGGVVRRLSGDLTLWVLGALASIISALTVAVWQAAQADTLSPSDPAAITGIYLILGMFLVIIAFLSILVRRRAPPLASDKVFADYLTTAPRVVLLYAFAIGAALFLRH